MRLDLRIKKIISAGVPDPKRPDETVRQEDNDGR